MILLPLLEKIQLLEAKLGKKYTKNIFEPFNFDSTDAIKVQEAGKKISEFIGLKGLVFVISYRTQKTGVGGHIELGNRPEVFIEIDNKHKSNSNIVLSILAHEICHKFLQVNDIKVFPEYDNEILTDIAIIYAGLGKRSMNGCETVTQAITKIGNQTTTTTTTNNVGYLNRSEFAFVYKIVCTMRQIPSETIVGNLSYEAIEAIRKTEKAYPSYFHKSIFDNKISQKLISDAMSDEIGDAQIHFGTLNKNIRELEKSIISFANRLENEFHYFTKTGLEKLDKNASQVINNDSHNFIRNLTLIETLENLKHDIAEKELYATKLIDSLSTSISFISDSYPIEYSGSSLEFLFQFKCPSCSHKLRIGEKKLARVKCPQCKYSFIANTGVDLKYDNKKLLLKKIGKSFNSIRNRIGNS